MVCRENIVRQTEPNINADRYVDSSSDDDELTNTTILPLIMNLVENADLVRQQVETVVQNKANRQDQVNDSVKYVDVATTEANW